MLQKKTKHIFLSILSGTLLSIPWLIKFSSFFSFIGFIPIFIIAAKLIEIKDKFSKLKFWFYSLIAMLVWNSFSLWWLVNSDFIAAISVILVYSFLMSIVFIGYFKTFNLFGEKTALFLFPLFWIAFEYLMMQTEISRPWLNLGNAFATNTILIQWYEYTGSFGGSLWVLIINVLMYNFIKRIIQKNNIKKITIQITLTLIIPIAISLWIFYTYKEKNKPIKIAIIQPSLDPYTEKFSLSMPEQIKIYTDLADNAHKFNPEYIIAPETAIPTGINLEELEKDESIISFKKYLKNFPNTKLIIGATTIKIIKQGQNKSGIAQKLPNRDDYFELYNSAIQLDNSEQIEIYHKSKLVPGVEFLPYPKILGIFSELMPELEGLAGNHKTQNERSVFKNNCNKYSVGTAICYESVYGEFITEFVNKGANLLFIITNDGWWGNTPGYKQHNSFAKLRAIETRRSIARSANTGISCFINQKGEILKSLEWNERQCLMGELNLNDKLSFYTKHGNYIARICTGLSIMLSLIFIGHIIKEKLRQKV